MLSPTPGEVYAERLEARASSARRLERRGRLLSNLRLALFALALFAAWGAFAWGALGQGRWSGLWVAPAAAAFGAAVVAHDGARRGALRARRGAEFYLRGLARLDGRFAGRGREGGRFARARSYAEHLDLFGRGSLFELLSGAQTAAGEEALARWLLEPAPPGEIRARQAAVAELRERVDLREDLAALGPDVRAGLDPAALADWGVAPGELPGRGVRALAAALAAATLAAVAAWIWLESGPLPLTAALAVQSGLALRLRRRVARVVVAVERAARDLELLSVLLARIERERFACPRLRALSATLQTEGVHPSVRIARLRRRVDLLDSRRNQLFAPIAPFLLWTTQCALAIEAWRARCGPRLGAWIRAIGELEALADLAGQAYEHPGDPFPEIAEGGALFEARGLGHPLIPESECVRNDLALGREERLLVVSGSNMSGKSTLLRSVGVNAVLAQAGGTVRAQSMRLSPLSVGASIRVIDSLLEGSSRFFAEITLLRGIVELAGGERPLLFLLDEILGGTNSHDRRIGAASVVRSLVERGAVGLITTHDLALAEIADGLGARAANVHFRDQLVAGELAFDYLLRPGVVDHSNALELMRAIGLDVEAATDT